MFYFPLFLGKGRKINVFTLSILFYLFKIINIQLGCYIGGYSWSTNEVWSNSILLFED